MEEQHFDKCIANKRMLTTFAMDGTSKVRCKHLRPLKQELLKWSFWEVWLTRV